MHPDPLLVDPATSLSHIGDEIVEKLVAWTKKLPFYTELPVEVHTQLLTKRWAELVLLSACYYACSRRTPFDAGESGLGDSTNPRCLQHRPQTTLATNRRVYH
jgi:hypothetical protein